MGETTTTPTTSTTTTWTKTLRVPNVIGDDETESEVEVSTFTTDPPSDDAPGGYDVRCWGPLTAAGVRAAGEWLVALADSLS